MEMPGRRPISVRQQPSIGGTGLARGRLCPLPRPARSSASATACCLAGCSGSPTVSERLLAQSRPYFSEITIVVGQWPADHRPRAARIVSAAPNRRADRTQSRRRHDTEAIHSTISEVLRRSAIAWYRVRLSPNRSASLGTVAASAHEAAQMLGHLGDAAGMLDLAGVHQCFGARCVGTFVVTERGRRSGDDVERKQGEQAVAVPSAQGQPFLPRRDRGLILSELPEQRAERNQDSHQERLVAEFPTPCDALLELMPIRSRARATRLRYSPTRLSSQAIIR